MKTIFLSAGVLSMLAFAACSNKPENAGDIDTDTLHSVVIPPDTAAKPNANLNSNLNYVDDNGKKQGHWKIFGKMQEDKRYGDLSLVADGDYRDGEKDGEWTYYMPDGKVEKTVFYVKGKAK